MRTLLLLPLALLLFAGCDSDDPFDPGDASFTCEQVSLTSQGTMTASTSSGSFAANCFQVSSFSGRLDITGYDLNLNTGQFNSVIQLETDASTLGSYVIDVDEDDPDLVYGNASFAPTGLSPLGATSGTVTLTESSANRVAGTFSFVTSNGSTVSGGQFSVSF